MTNPIIGKIRIFIFLTTIFCGSLLFATKIGKKTEITTFNLLQNGSFEKTGQHGNGKVLKEKDYDIDTAANAWCEYWSVNPGVGYPGKIRIISDEGAQDGKRYLQVETKGSHVYTPGVKTDKTYHWQFWAKGNTVDIDGKKIVPKISAVIYNYGVKDKLSSLPIFLNSQVIKTIHPTNKWRCYKGTLKTNNNKATRFSFVLDLSGKVSVDNVALTEPTVPLNRVFYLSFEESFDATEASGNGKATVLGKVNFISGKKGNAAVFRNNAHLEYDALKNFDQNEGTIAMWVRPFSDFDDGKAHCLFEVPSKPYDYIDSGFFLTKGFSDTIAANLFYFNNCPPYHGMSSPEMKDFWEKDKWVHLVFTWSQKKGEMSIYADGIKLPSSKTPFTIRPSVKGRKMIVGARSGGSTPTPKGKWDNMMGNKKRNFTKEGANSANAAIDELQIFDRMVSAQEAWLLSGKKGTPLAKKIKKVEAKELYVLNNDNVTPCIPFAKPMARKPKILFITPNSVARDVVELSQRMDIDYEAFVGVQYNRQNQGAFALQYKGSRIDRYFHVEDRLKEINEKLDHNPEVIILVNADLSKLPEVRSKIYQKVKEGAALIMTSKAVHNGPWSKNRIKNGSKTIANGIPWSSLIDLFPNTPLKPDELSDKVIQTFRYGKGKVIAVRFRKTPVKHIGFLHPDAGLTPCLYNIAETKIPYTTVPYTREWDTRYGQYLSLIGRVINWAISEKGSCRIIFPGDVQRFKYASLPLNDALKLEIQGENPGKFTLELSIKDSLGMVEHQYQQKLEITMTDEVNKVAFTIPVLPAGQYYADFQLKQENQVIDWGSVAFYIVDPEEIDFIKLTTDSIEKGDDVRGKVMLLNYAKNDLTLNIQAVDNNNRIYEKKTIHIKRGEKIIPFELKLDTPSTIASYIEAELIRKGKIISKKSIVTFVPKRNLTSLHADEFPSLIWGGNPVCNASGMIFLRKIRKLGFNIMHAWPINTTMRNIAMADITPSVYITRLVMNAKDGGIPVHRMVQHLTNDGSYHNPIIKGAFQENIQGLLKDVRKYGPLFYSLGDENQRYGESGYSPFGIQAYTSHLMKKYGTIQNLNDNWGSSYRSFHDVPRLTVGEAKKMRNVPAMIDHRTVQEAVYREMYTHLQKVVKEYDPKASVGAEGSPTDDLEAMLEQMEFWAPYGHDPRVNKLMRNVGRPDHITGHWYGAYEEHDLIPDAGLTRFWEQLFKKYGNASFYFASGCGIGGIFDPGAGLRPFFKQQLPDFKLIMNGIGQLIRQTTIKPSGIYMHWSQPSRWGIQADDALGTPSENDAVLLKIMDALDVPNWGYITDRQLKSNPEIINKAKLLILPASQCISTVEAAAFVKFVRDGGIILGIGPVGMRNEFGKELPSSQLDELFGVNMKSPALPQEISGLNQKINLFGKTVVIKSGLSFVNKSLAATEGKVLVKIDGTPIIVHHKYGKGDAVLLNLNSQSLDRDSLENIIAAVLSKADISSFVRFSPTPGPDGRYGVLQNGDMTLVGVIMDHRPGKWNEGKIHLKEKMHVYDVKNGIYLGELNEIPVKGMPSIQSAVLFALQKAKITGISIDAPNKVQKNKKVTIACNVNADQPSFWTSLTGGEIPNFSCAGRVVRIELRDPDDKTRRHYQRMAYLDKNGKGNVTLEFAINDPAGEWTVIATDIASGIKAGKKLTIE